jgi:virginiamycin A acetyltransferase
VANFFDQTSVISAMAAIDVSSRGSHTYIGAGSHVDDFVKIKHVGGSGDIRIGNNVYLNSGTVLYSGNGIQIGDNVLIGPNCNIVPTNHEFAQRDMLIRHQGFQPSRGGVIIEDNVWIGAAVTLLDGAIIRTGAIVAAGSVVTGEIPAFSIASGVPAKVKKYRP